MKDNSHMDDDTEVSTCSIEVFLISYMIILDVTKNTTEAKDFSFTNINTLF